MKQTLGEQRVRVDFNQTNDKLVDAIKVQSANLINQCEELRNEKTLTEEKVYSNERQRLISLAQTAYEEAAMWAVKAIYTE